MASLSSKHFKHGSRYPNNGRYETEDVAWYVEPSEKRIIVKTGVPLNPANSYFCARCEALSKSAQGGGLD